MGLLSKTGIISGKGLSILMIVMHNVVHIMSERGENEFGFNADNLAFYLEHFLDHPVTYFFSFFGWVGVSFFVFASGYGLSSKYGSRPISLFNWIKNHYLKLFFLLLPAFFLYVAICYSQGPKIAASNVILEQLLVINVIRPQAITPGIYWYIGMALQLYVWFLLLRKLSTKQLTFFGIIAMLLITLTPGHLMPYFRHNSIGWLVDFVFGMLCARANPVYFTREYKLSALIAGILILLCSCLTHFTFTFSGIGFCLIIMSVSTTLNRIRGLYFIGTISAAIYVVHAVVRTMWFNSLFSSSELQPLSLAAVILTLSVLLSIPYTLYYKKITKTLIPSIYIFKKFKLSL